jgi:hypothetical protein
MIAHGLKGPTGMVTLLDCHRPNYAKRAGPYPCAEYMVGPVPPNRVGVLGNDARRRGGGHVAGRPVAGICWHGKPKAARRQRCLCRKPLLSILRQTGLHASPSRRHSPVAQPNKDVDPSIVCCESEKHAASTPQQDEMEKGGRAVRGLPGLFPGPYQEQNRVDGAHALVHRRFCFSRKVLVRTPGWLVQLPKLPIDAVQYLFLGGGRWAYNFS